MYVYPEIHSGATQAPRLGKTSRFQALQQIEDLGFQVLGVAKVHPENKAQKKQKLEGLKKIHFLFETST